MKFCSIFIVVVFCSACSTMTKSIPAQSTLDLHRSYIFGRFPLKTNKALGMNCRAGVALVVSGNNGQEYFLSFDIEDDWAGGYKIFEVNPGPYEIKQYFLTHDRNGPDDGRGYSARERDNYESTLKFTALSGRAYYIGDYNAETICNCEAFKTCYTVSFPKNNFDSALEVLHKKYENLHTFSVQSVLRE